MSFGGLFSNAGDIPPPSFGGRRSGAGAPFSTDFPTSGDIPPPHPICRPSNASGILPFPFGGRRSNAGGPVSVETQFSSDISPTYFGGPRANAAGDPLTGEVPKAYYGGGSLYGSSRANAAGDFSSGEVPTGGHYGGSRSDPFSGDISSGYYACRRYNSGEVPTGGLYGGSRSIYGDPFSGDYRRLKSGDVITAYPGGLRSYVARPIHVVDIYVEDPFLDPYYPPLLGIEFGRSRMAQSKLDWKETPTEHVFQVEVPGLSKEEVKVEVEKGKFLKISGEKKREAAESSDTWHAAERSIGAFVRKFKLYGNPKVDEIRAKMENGVLAVSVPKGTPDVKVVEITG